MNAAIEDSVFHQIMYGPTYIYMPPNLVGTIELFPGMSRKNRAMDNQGISNDKLGEYFNLTGHAQLSMRVHTSPTGEETVMKMVAPGDITGCYHILVCNLPFGIKWQQLKDWVRDNCPGISVVVQTFRNSTCGWIRVYGRENFDTIFRKLNGGVFNNRAIFASGRNATDYIHIKEYVPPGFRKDTDSPDASEGPVDSGSSRGDGKEVEAPTDKIYTTTMPIEGIPIAWPPLACFDWETSSMERLGVMYNRVASDTIDPYINPSIPVMRLIELYNLPSNVSVAQIDGWVKAAAEPHFDSLEVIAIETSSIYDDGMPLRRAYIVCKNVQSACEVLVLLSGAFYPTPTPDVRLIMAHLPTAGITVWEAKEMASRLSATTVVVPK